MAQWNQSENNIQEAITIHVGIVNGDHTEAGGGLVCFAVYAIFALYYPSPENALFHLAGCDIDSGSFKPLLTRGRNWDGSGIPGGKGSQPGTLAGFTTSTHLAPSVYPVKAFMKS